MVLSKAKQFVVKLDLLAPPVRLNIDGRTRTKTLFGSALTMIYLLLVISISAVVLKTFWDTSHPGISTENSESDTFPTISHEEGSLLPVLYATSGGLTEIIPSDQFLRYFTPVYIRYFYALERQPDGTSKPKHGAKVMTLKPCSNLEGPSADFYANYNSSEFFRKYAPQYGLCVETPLEEVFVEGGGSSTKVHLLNLEIKPCSLPTGCASEEEINKVALIISVPGVTMNLSNYQDPVRGFPNNDNSFQLNTLLDQKYQSKLSLGSIYDDRGPWIGRSLRQKFTTIDKVLINNRARNKSQISCTMQEVKTRQCDNYFEFEYMSSSKQTIITRKYKTLAEVFSEIGGMNSISMLFFWAINYFYVKMLGKDKDILINKIWPFLRKSPRNNANSKKDVKESSVSRLNTTNLQASPSKKAGILNEAQGRSTDPSRRGQENLADDYSVQASSREEWKVLRKQAKQILTEGLDVASIFKELNSIKVITHLLLKDYHLRMIPVVAFSLGGKDTKDKGKLRHSLAKRTHRMSIMQPGGIHPGVFSPQVGGRYLDKASLASMEGGGSAGVRFRREHLYAEDKDVDPSQAIQILQDRRALLMKDPHEELTLEEKVDLICYDGLKSRCGKYFRNMTQRDDGRKKKIPDKVDKGLKESESPAQTPVISPFNNSHKIKQSPTKLYPQNSRGSKSREPSLVRLVTFKSPTNHQKALSKTRPRGYSYNSSNLLENLDSAPHSAGLKKHTTQSSNFGDCDSVNPFKTSSIGSNLLKSPERPLKTTSKFAGSNQVSKDENIIPQREIGSKKNSKHRGSRLIPNKTFFFQQKQEKKQKRKQSETILEKSSSQSESPKELLLKAGTTPKI